MRLGLRVTFEISGSDLLECSRSHSTAVAVAVVVVVVVVVVTAVGYDVVAAVEA